MLTTCSQCHTQSRSQAAGDGCHTCLRGIMLACGGTAAEFAAMRPAQHPDDDMVDKLAVAMKAKMAKQRAKGYGGWTTCPTARLQRQLTEHVGKGDPVDVANFCGMLFSRGEPTAVLVRPEVDIKLLSRTVDQFEDCEATSTPYATLLSWAGLGILECTHFTLTDAGRSLLESENAHG